MKYYSVYINDATASRYNQLLEVVVNLNGSIQCEFTVSRYLFTSFLVVSVSWYLIRRLYIGIMIFAIFLFWLSPLCGSDGEMVCRLIYIFVMVFYKSCFCIFFSYVECLIYKYIALSCGLGKQIYVYHSWTLDWIRHAASALKVSRRIADRIGITTRCYSHHCPNQAGLIMYM